MQFRISALCIALCIAIAAPAVMAKDGTYTATKLGRNGDVTVQVAIENDRIKNVKVQSWSETHPIADLAGTQVPADIVKFQTTNVDVVSGATLSSMAITAAVRDCIKAAGLDPSAFSKKAPKPDMAPGLVKETGDVVVIGAGGAGVSAAVAAAQAGKNVIVIEKAHFIGGNTSVAGGGYNAADPALESKHEMTAGQKKIVEDLIADKVRSPLHQEIIDKLKTQWDAYKKSGKTGLFDSPELHALQTWQGGDYIADLNLVYKLCKMAPETQKLLADMGLKWDDYTTQYVGALWPRSHKASNYNAGVGFIDTYLSVIEREKLPVKFILQTEATDLIVENGAVVGVKGHGRDGKTYEIRANNGVVIATGGFAGNVEMHMKYDTVWGGKLGPNVPTSNISGIDGKGILMAEKIGAATIDMGLIQLLPTCDAKTGSTSTKMASGTCIYVNKDGKRFVNELGRRDVLAKAALAQPDGMFFVISCESTNFVKDGRNMYGIRVKDLLDRKQVYSGETLEELAKNAGINPANLVKTVEAWQQFCKDLKGDPFGRFTCDAEAQLPKGPWYATPMSPAAHHTMGGLKINADTQVLDKAGTPIPGLYAAGEVTGGIHGGNRLGANAIPDVLNYGRLAGQMAANFTAK